MQRYGEDIPPMVLVGCGALAGLAASTATFPLEVLSLLCLLQGTTVPSHTSVLSSRVSLPLQYIASTLAIVLSGRLY